MRAGIFLFLFLQRRLVGPPGGCRSFAGILQSIVQSAVVGRRVSVLLDAKISSRSVEKPPCQQRSATNLGVEQRLSHDQTHAASNGSLSLAETSIP